MNRSFRPLALAILLAALAASASRITAQSPDVKVPSSAAKLSVASDLAKRLARWKPVEMPFRAQGLSAKERRLVEKLVEASQELENIFWRQSDPEGMALYQSLTDSSDSAAQALRRYLWINGSRWDLLDGEPAVVRGELGVVP